MPIEFYDVKKREKVQIPESEVRKTTYEKEGKDGKVNVRYALRATNEGTNLTKFVKQSDREALDAPVVIVGSANDPGKSSAMASLKV